MDGGGIVSEKSIVKSITRWLKQNAPQGWFMKIHGGGMQRAGVPDILLVLSGRAIFFEVKQPGKVPTALQKYVISRLQAAGALVAVVHDPGEVERHLGDWGLL